MRIKQHFPSTRNKVNEIFRIIVVAAVVCGIELIYKAEEWFLGALLPTRIISIYNMFSIPLQIFKPWSYAKPIPKHYTVYQNHNIPIPVPMFKFYNHHTAIPIPKPVPMPIPIKVLFF